jgi:hypothetical protein
MSLRSRYSIVLSCVFFFLTSCSKKNEAPKSSFELLEYLPKNAVAFVSWDALNPRYKELMDSKWGQMYDVSLTDSTEVTATLKLLKVFNAESHNTGTISKGLTFYTVEKEPYLKVDAAYVVSSRENADFRSLKSKLVGELEKQGIPHEKQTDPQLGEIFRFVVKDVPQGWPSEFFLSITDNLFTLTSSKSFLNITAKKTDADKNQVLLDSRYQEYAKNAVANSSFQIGALNLDAVMPLLQESVKTASPGAEISESPYSFAVMDGGFDKGPVFNIDFITRDPAGNPDPNTTKNSEALARLIPEAASFSFEISGGIITSLLGGAAVPAGADIAALINRVAVFVRDGGIGSLVPEITIAISSTDPATNKSKIVDLLKSLSMLAQGALSPWQSAKVGQVDIDYTISPIGGFGLYVGNVNGANIISSSDKIFTYYQDPNQVGSSLSTRLETIKAGTETSAISGHVDFVKLVTLLNTLKGTASLFAPQANSQDMDLRTDFMKQLGFLYFNLIEKRDRLSARFIFSEQ